MSEFTNKEILLKFQEDIPRMKRFWKHPVEIKVSLNGEICYDTGTEEYIVYEETYAYLVGRTCYPLVALSMLESYGENYLEG